MRDAEHELSQDESAVEITPLPAENELPAGTVHKSALPVGRAHWSGAWRYILTAIVLCLGLAFLVANVVLLPHQSSKQSSHSGSPAAASTATPATSNTSNDYSVNTTIVNGVAYVGAANGAVYALRSDNGSLLWRHKIDPGAGAAPLVDSGTVYITAGMSDVGPGYLYALRASDGVQLWHDTTRGSSYNSLVVDNQVVYTSASGDNGPGTVYALRASDGMQLWHYSTTTFTSVPAVVNGIAYLVSDQELSALQASNGRLLWRATVQGNSGLLPPQVINGVLYFITTKISFEGTATPTSQVNILPQVGTMGNLLQSVLRMAPVKQTLPLKGGVSSVYAVRISDGAVLWHYTMSKENGNNWANWLSIENGTVYAGTYVDQDKSYIYALRSSDGSVLWRQAMHRGMSANAFVASGVIYIASFINDGSLNQGSGAVYALRAS